MISTNDDAPKKSANAATNGPIISATTTTSAPAQSSDGAGSKQQPSQKPLPTVKTHLSRELQQYYSRLVSSLLPSSSSSSSSSSGDDRKRTAALTSLRADAGLAPVLPYLARWVAEGVVATLRRDGDGDADGEGEGDVDRKSLGVYLDVIGALLENERLLVEPYVSGSQLNVSPIANERLDLTRLFIFSYINSFPHCYPFSSPQHSHHLPPLPIPLLHHPRPSSAHTPHPSSRSSYHPTPPRTRLSHPA